MSINFVLNDFEVSTTMTVAATLENAAPTAIDCSATAVFYIAVSDVSNVFQFQTDASNISDVASDDIKYFVDVTHWPINVNAANAMMDDAASVNPIAVSDTRGTYPRPNMLVSDDYIRYLALRLFNTYHGVDLFNNVSAMQANIVSVCGTNSKDVINAHLGLIDVSAGTLSMSGVSPFKYLTNANTTTANISRELMLQIASSQPARYATIAASSLRQKIPLLVNDSLNFKVILNAASGQNALTGVAAVPARSYNVKMIIVDTPVNTVSILV